MKRALPTLFAETLLLIFLALLPLASQMPPPQPQTLPLKCAKGDCPLLHGIPQTAGMRSGFVRLKPRGSVGWHTTGQNEEALVIRKRQSERIWRVPLSASLRTKNGTKQFLGGTVLLLFLFVLGSTAFAQRPLAPSTLSFGEQMLDQPSAVRAATLKSLQGTASPVAGPPDSIQSSCAVFTLF